MHPCPAAEFLDEFALVADSHALIPLLDQIRFVFHGVDVRDLAGVEQAGFRWLSGKASFSLDAEYTVRKYATLGLNSRHRFGPRFAQDLNRLQSDLATANRDEAAHAAQARWSHASELTALLVIDRRDDLVRPGVGGTLLAHGESLLGGLSKWLHFHLGIWRMTASEWLDTSTGRLANFLLEQDQHYGTSFASRFENLAPVANPAWSHLDRESLVAVIPPDSWWRRSLAELTSLDDADELACIAEMGRRLRDSANPAPSSENFAHIALGIALGCHWGRLITTVRKLLLVIARQRALQLIKIDSPHGDWTPDLWSDERAVEEFRWLEQHHGPASDSYQEYRHACLNVLRSGWR